MPTTRDSELDDFKTHIDLRQFAAAQGYELDVIGAVARR
jgi:hypothetical protein